MALLLFHKPPLCTVLFFSSCISPRPLLHLPPGLWHISSTPPPNPAKCGADIKRASGGKRIYWTVMFTNTADWLSVWLQIEDESWRSVLLLFASWRLNCEVCTVRGEEASGVLDSLHSFYWHKWCSSHYSAHLQTRGALVIKCSCWQWQYCTQERGSHLRSIIKKPQIIATTVIEQAKYRESMFLR